MSKAKKNLTIDDLSEIVTKGFAETKIIFTNVKEDNDILARMVTRGFEGVNNRLDKVEGRLDGVESRLGKVENRLDKVEQEMVSLGPV